MRLACLLLVLLPQLALAQGVQYRPGPYVYVPPGPALSGARAASASGVVDWRKANLSGAWAGTSRCGASLAGGDFDCAGFDFVRVGSPATGSGYSGQASTVFSGTGDYFKIPARKIASVGDSIMAALAIQARFASVSGISGIDSFAVSGKQSGDILGQWRASVQGKGYTDLLLEGGVNDFNVAGADPSVPLGNFTTLINEATADGVRVLWANVSPEMGFASWTSGIQAKIEAYNAAQAPLARSLGATPIDLYATLGDPNEPRQLLAAYDSGDHLHLALAGSNAAGDAYYAPWFNPTATPSEFTGALTFASDSATGYHYLLGKSDHGGTDYEDFFLRLDGGTNLIFYIVNPSAQTSSVTCGSVTPFAWSAVAFSRDAAGMLRCNLNGVAATPVQGYATLGNHNIALEIGASGAQFAYDGHMVRAYWKSGRAANDAELAKIVSGARIP